MAAMIGPAAAATPGSAVRLTRAAQEFTARRSRTCRARVPVPPAAVESATVPPAATMASFDMGADMSADGPALLGTDAAGINGPAALERAELLALIQRQQATIRDQKRALSDQRRSLDAAVAETLRAAEEVASDTLTAAAEEDARLAAAARRELAALRAQLAEERPRAQVLEAELAAVTSELIATRGELGVAVSHLALLRDRMQVILFGRR